MNIAQRKILQMFLDLIFYESAHMKDGMLISDEAKRLVRKYPVAGRLLIVAGGTALILHLASLLDPKHDLVSQEFWAEVHRRFFQ